MQVHYFFTGTPERRPYSKARKKLIIRNQPYPAHPNPTAEDTHIYVWDMYWRCLGVDGNLLELAAFLALILHIHQAWAGLTIDPTYSSPTSSPGAFYVPMWLRFCPYTGGAHQLSGTGTDGRAGKRRRIECICMRNQRNEDEEMKKNAMLNGVPRAAKRVRDSCCCESLDEVVM